MRRLRPYQEVSLELDYEADLIDCRVLAISGAVAALHNTSEIARHVSRKLTTGSLCYMTFSYGGTPVALRGVVRMMPGAPALEFIVIDGVQVQERRAHVRRALVAPIRLTESDEPTTTLETSTVDLSLGGARLARIPGLGNGPEWKVELAPSGLETPIRCRARLAHAAAASIGIQFVEMPEPDRIRLADVLAEHERHGGPAA